MVILVMGTTGAGKSTIGDLLAARLHWAFLEGDDFHPPANIEKMKHGIPLTDADRFPWLANIHAELVRRNQAGQNAVLACSALKQIYRDQLSAGLDLQTVYLRGTFEAMRHHIQSRHGHFAGESILAGQFADLEEPRNAIVLDVSHPPEKLVAEALARLSLPPAPR
ncbi:MAG TPA: gluconokinase [Candidatus Acidoferrum sp.]